MSDILDSFGNVIPTSPPPANRRGAWIVEAKNLDIKRPGNSIKFWRQKKADLVREAETVLNRGIAEERDLTAGESAWYETTLADAQFAAERVAEHEKIQQENMAKYSQPGTLGTGDDARDLRQLQAIPLRGRHFAELFGAAPKDSPFQSFDEFLGIIARNQFHPALQAASGMSEGVMSQGGFLIPVEYSSRLLDSALEQSVLWGRVRVEPMVSATKVVSTFANEDTSAGKPFGLTLQWIAEGDTFSESKALMRQIQLNSKKAGIYVPFSRELGEDAPNFAQQLSEATSAALAWGLDDAILNGPGASRPLGAVNAPSTVVVNKEPGQTAGTFLFENVTAMYSRLHSACAANSIWLANPSTLPQLLTMSVSLGASGAWYPALKEGSGTYSLLGRPLFLSEKCAALGQKGDVILIDPSQYILGLRRGITVALSEHVKFSSDEIVLKVTIRLDGLPAWAKPYQPKAGPTTSWCVVLQAR
jgi:HK97 family phage major capsid protein